MGTADNRSGVLGPLYETARGIIEENTDLVASPVIIDARMQTDFAANRKFSLDFQTANTGLYRDRTQMRLEHTLTVRYLQRVNPNDQAESYHRGMVSEEDLIDAMLDQSEWQGAEGSTLARVMYTGTTRSMLPNREYLLFEVEFDVEGDYAVTS